MMIGMMIAVTELTGLGCEYVNWLYVAEVNVKCWASVNKVMRIRILEKAGNFFIR